MAVITVGTWDLLRKSFDLAMDAVPHAIDPGAVRGYLAALPGVCEIHDLHIWGMSTTEAAMTAHVVKSDGVRDDGFLAGVARELHDRFGIEHVTIQVEQGDAAHPCRLAGEDTI